MTSHFPKNNSSFLGSAWSALIDLSVWFFISTLGLIPLGTRRRIARTLAQLFSRIPLRDHKFAAKQLAVFANIAQPEPVVRAMYESIFQTALETVNLAPLLKRPERWICCPDKNFILNVVQQETPCIALTAHTGNWELMAAYMVSLGVPLRTVARPARGLVLQALLRQLRERWGVKSLWRAENGGVSLGIPRALKQRETLAALIDQDTRVKGEFSHFFGVPAKTPTSLIRIGKKKGARFVTAFNVRRDDGTFLIRVQEIPSDLKVHEILDLYHTRLEHILREHPDQWVWFHKRWRSLESGERLSGEKYLKLLQEQAHHS